MSLRGAIFSVFGEIIQTALISLGIFLLVYIFLVQPHRVKGDSMLPNFRDGELLLTEKVTYRIYKPERGDVIVFGAPVGRKVDYIKRIIGLPNEMVRIESGTVYINDEKLAEPYEIQQTQGNVNLTLSADQYFVLGDNRSSSSDSRSFGTISFGSIKGRAWLVYWPLFKSSKAGGMRVISQVDYGIPDSFYDP